MFLSLKVGDVSCGVALSQCLQNLCLIPFIHLLEGSDLLGKRVEIDRLLGYFLLLDNRAKSPC